MPLSDPDIEELRAAKRLLEHSGLAAKLSDYVGGPMQQGFALLPKRWHAAVHAAAGKSIAAALDVALLTMDHRSAPMPSNRWHKLAVGASGAAGGMFGLPALTLELPVSTTIMLRSIADIARSQGEDLKLPQARLECLQVLALGARAQSDERSETAYFTARTAMAKAVSEALQHLAASGLTQKGAPALLRLIAVIAARFSIVVSEKAAAQALPVLGAVGGAVINTLFIDHFQDMGKGHFIVRRLERAHGAEEVKRIYLEL